MTQLGMVIDTKACIGCNTCAVKCKQANNVPNGILWNRILTVGGARGATAWPASTRTAMRAIAR